jgi:hypothetical protein
MLRLEMLWKADFPKGDFGSFGKDPTHGPSRHQIPKHTINAYFCSSFSFALFHDF